LGRKLAILGSCYRASRSRYVWRGCGGIVKLLREQIPTSVRINGFDIGIFAGHIILFGF
jgi:hypothetical protein